jgi:hypothetical protein
LDPEVTSLTIEGLVDGHYALKVIAWDGAGNSGVMGVNVTIDTTDPSLTIVAPVDGGLINTSTTSVIFTASDLGSGLLSVSIQMDGGAWVDVTGDFTQAFGPLAMGPHTVSMAAIDRAGNIRNVSANFVVDYALPEASIVSPTNGTCYPFGTVLVEFTASDLGSGLDHVWLRLNGSAWIDVTGSTSYPLDLHSDGIYTITLRAVDLAGGQREVTATFDIDGTPPVVVITHPAEGAVLNATTVRVDLTAVDQGSGLDSVLLKVNGGTWTDITGETYYDLSGLIDGLQTVTVSATDKMGNTRDVTLHFIVDTLVPQLEVTSPVQGEWRTTPSFEATWTATDPGSGISKIWIKLDGGTWTDIGITSTRTLSGLAQGSHTLMVRAFDQALSFTTVTVTFQVDSVAPSVTILTPSNGSYLAASEAPASWSGLDAGSGLANYWVRIDGGEWIDKLMGVSHAFDGLGEGPHTVNVKATDHAGNLGTASAQFVIDTQAPAVTVLSPLGGSRFNSLSVPALVTFSDPTSGLKTVLIYLNGVTTYGSVSPGGSWSGTLGGVDGINTLIVDVMDKAGNQVNVTVRFTIETVLPTVLDHSPVGTGNPIDAVVTATFSEEMNHTSVQVSMAGAIGALTWSGNTVIFTPSTALAYGTTFTVVVNGNDLAGNAMSALSWTFTTVQLSHIQGTVVLNNKWPAVNATVDLGNGITTLTDENGRFSFSVPAGQYDLTISKAGYQTAHTSVTTLPGQNVQLDIVELSPSKSTIAGIETDLLVIMLLLAVSALVLLFVLARRRRK